MEICPSLARSWPIRVSDFARKREAHRERAGKLALSSPSAQASGVASKGKWGDIGESRYREWWRGPG